MIFVMTWITFGLIAVMHGPLDALSDSAESLSSYLGSISVMSISGEAGSYGDSHCLSAKRSGTITLAAIEKPALTHSARWPKIPVIKLNKPRGNLCFLLANWQFWRRAALSPRAPSALV